MHWNLASCLTGEGSSLAERSAYFYARSLPVVDSSLAIYFGPRDQRVLFSGHAPEQSMASTSSSISSCRREAASKSSLSTAVYAGRV